MRIPDRIAGMALLLLAGCNRPDAPPRELTIFAAASLSEVAEDLARSFEADHPGYHVVVNAAASSVLARQIDEGAPADVFFLASEEWGTYLADRERVEGSLRRPISNRLVVVARPGAAALTDLASFSSTASMALADPEHVPAGIYAREALTCLGIWDQIAPAVLPALDVRAALHAVEQSAADFAIVYATDVAQSNITHSDVVQVLFPVADSCQPAIRYTLGQVKASADAEGAASLVAYMSDRSRRTLWERYGFVVCDAADQSVSAPC